MTGLAVTVLLLIAVSAVSLRSARRSTAAASWVEHTLDVENDLTDLAAAMAGAESATRGYLLTEDPRYLESYAGSPVLVEAQIRELRRKVSDNPVQQRHLDILAPLVAAKLAWQDGLVTSLRTGGVAAPLTLMRTGRGRALASDIRKELRSMEREEERLMTLRVAEQARLDSRTQQFIGMTLVIGLLFAVLAGVLIHRDLAERRRAESALRSLSMIDELTGLFNRRGFYLHAEDRVSLAGYLVTEEALFFADLDELKTINDVHGHAAGDEAIVAAAGLLRETFPDTDVLARLGGDEFIALAVLAPGEKPEDRATTLRRRIDAWNALEKNRFRLSVSVGITPVEKGRRLDDLLTEADRAMYARKQAARAERSSTGQMAGGA